MYERRLWLKSQSWAGANGMVVDLREKLSIGWLEGLMNW
jgi:hypothetical protein